MDQAVKVVGGCSAFYTMISVILTHVLKTPKHLDTKEKRDFIGQHVSLVHSLLAIIITFYVYFTEGGIHYNDPTQLSHVIAFGVIIT